MHPAKLKHVIRSFVIAISALTCTPIFGQIVRIENNQFNDDSTHWHGNAELNLYAIKNTNSLFRLATGSQIRYKDTAHTFISINEFRFILSGSEGVENRGYQHFRYQKSIQPIITLEAFSQSQFDHVLNIGFRQLLGAGPRIEWLAKKTYIESFTGWLYMYEYEEEFSTEIINRAHRFSGYFVLQKAFKQLRLHGIMYYQPNIADWSDYRISGSGSLIVQFRKHLALQIRGDITSDTKPATEAARINYTLLQGITWEF